MPSTEEREKLENELMRSLTPDEIMEKEREGFLQLELTKKLQKDVAELQARQRIETVKHFLSLCMTPEKLAIVLRDELKKLDPFDIRALPYLTMQQREQIAEALLRYMIEYVESGK